MEATPRKLSPMRDLPPERKMRVGVDEPGNDELAPDVEDLRPRADEARHLPVRADGDDLAVA